MKLILLGAPGAGKGTQAVKLNEVMGLTHVSTGDIFRKNMREETALGMEVKAYIDKGLLVPDEVTIKLITDTLSKIDGDYMLDGFPRTIAQAKALDEVADIDVALNIDVDLNVLTDRISGRRSCPDCGSVGHISTMTGNNCTKCGSEMIQRKDDNVETVKSRLVEYSSKTAPLIEYYEKAGKLINVDGMGTPSEVWDRVSKVLSK